MSSLASGRIFVRNDRLPRHVFSVRREVIFKSVTTTSNMFVQRTNYNIFLLQLMYANGRTVS